MARKPSIRWLCVCIAAAVIVEVVRTIIFGVQHNAFTGSYYSLDYAAEALDLLGCAVAGAVAWLLVTFVPGVVGWVLAGSIFGYLIGRYWAVLTERDSLFWSDSPLPVAILLGGVIAGAIAGAVLHEVHRKKARPTGHE